MSHSPEFSRRVPLSRIGGGVTETVEANVAEREALARRFGIPAIDHLECRFVLTPESKKEFLAEGRLSARVTQVCVITAEAFDDVLAETFVVRFIPENEMPDDDFDIESMDLDGPDEVPHDGRALDIGETAAEQLALMLDPYPRKAGAGLENAVDVAPAEGEEGAGSEEGLDVEGGSSGRRRNPFAALVDLKNGDKKE